MNALFLGYRHGRECPLADQSAFKLGKGDSRVRHCFTHGRRQVQVKIKHANVESLGLRALEQRSEVNDTTADAIELRGDYALGVP
jgi:hypothetical protein